MSDLLTLERKLGAALGLRPRRGSEGNLRRELRALQRELGVDIGDIIARLDADPDLVGRLAGAITVEETFFLRHAHHFDRLVDHVRDRLVRESRESLLLWSAGCSSGEEPLSMAIAIHRALGPERLARVRIVANDVDGTAIRKAKRAVYGSWSFRGTDPRVIERYFEKVGDDVYRPVPVLRDAVTFEHRSLDRELGRFAAGSVDGIFFRNVAIYLTDAALAHLYTGFSRVLRKGGLFVLGPSDPSPPRGLLPAEVLRQSLFPSAGTPALAHPAPVVGPPVTQLPPLPIAVSPALRPLAEALAPPPRAAPSRSQGAPDGGGSSADEAASARELAHRGRFVEALAAVERALSSSGPTGPLLGLRGCIRLASSDTVKGVEDLRAALFLDPNDSWLRFQYAMGMHALHRHRAAKAQLADVLGSLEGESDERALGDGETTVGDLRRATRELLGRIP